MSRWIGFIITILLGAAAGLFYGLRLDPVEFVDITPDSLREDYRADYVLMVAEVYRADGDAAAAVGRLAFLGDTEPLAVIQSAAQFATEVGYTAKDLAKIDDLFDGVMAWYNTPQGGETP